MVIQITTCTYWKNFDKLTRVHRIVINIYLTIQCLDLPQKLLAFTDSSSALGWLYKASFTSNQPAHDEVVRWLATTLIKNDAALYSQQNRGIHNIVADVLSRDWYIPESHLIHMLSLLLPAQTPKNLKTLDPSSRDNLVATLATSFLDQNAGRVKNF